MPPVSVVILNWNGKSWLEQFLPSVLASTYPNLHIMVVDNGSTDDSIAWTAEHFPSVEIVALPENYGFAEGNNKAIPHIKTPYFVLLNSDVEVSPGWLEPLVARIEMNEKIASVQPKVLAHHAKDTFEYAGAAGGFIDRLGIPFCRGRIFDTVEKDKGQYDTAMPVLWATGACCLVRTSVVEKIGLFDGSFFAHMEEIDFCWRAWNLGYSIWCEPASTVWHVGGGSLPQGNPRKTYLNVRNSLACMYKNLPSNQLFPKIFLRLIVDGIAGVKSFFQLDVGTVGAILKGHFHFYGRLLSLRKERRRIYAETAPRLPDQGYFSGSIIWQSMVKKKNHWSELPYEN